MYFGSQKPYPEGYPEGFYIHTIKYEEWLKNFK